MTVPFECDSCPGGATAGETIVDGRLHWSVSHHCPGATVEECGRDALPEHLRAALLAENGTFRLRVDPGSSRTAAMRVLRRRGVALTDLAPALDTGLTGTEAEMRLAALRFAEEGVTTTVEALTHPG